MKRKIQSLVIVGLLLVIAIACQHDNDLDTQIASKTEIHEKVSINEAKALFEEEEAIKVKQKLANKNGYFLKINPDWNSFQQDRDFGNGNYSKVTTTLFGTDIKGEILFIKQNDSIKQFLFMTRTDSINTQGEVLDAQLYFFETNGKLVEAYKIENQRITKRLKIHKQRSLTARRGGEECGFLQKVDVLGWDVGCTSGNNDNWGSGKKNTWGPNPFTFDGVNELYGVTVEHWHSSNNYTFSHQMNFRNFRLMGNNAGSSFSEAGAHIIRTNPPKPKEIIDRITNEKIKCLHDKLRNGNNDYVKEIFSKFEGKGTEFDIVISSENKVLYEGREVNAKTSFTSGSKAIHIRISESKAVGRSALEIARTIFHEYIHADIHRKIQTGDVSNPSDFKSVYEKYKSEREEQYQHEMMGKLYVETMRDALKKFHKEQLTEDYNKFVKNYEREPSDELYEALAWQGLKEHNVDAYKELNPDKKKSIDEVLQTEAKMLTKNCN